VTRTSHRLIWLVPSNQVSNFPTTNHGRWWTTVDTTPKVKHATALAAWPGSWVRDEEATALPGLAVST